METIGPARTLVDRTYDAILGAICDGTLAPGERLTQDQVAARLNVSRQPVGQALSILKTQGFVEDAGRRGLIVARLDPAFFHAIYELRLALDPLAAGLAAVRADEIALVEGRRILAEGQAALRSGSVPAAIQADMRFHMFVYEQSGNDLVVQTMALYWNHQRRAMGEVLRTGTYRAAVWKEHAAMFDAIARRDRAAAERLAREHIEAATRHVPAMLHGAPEHPEGKRRIAVTGKDRAQK
ncbi:MAG: GntR family transcriptional regulator [Betaproteobacteria bacterium]|nr:GntR family transcriptional regulator [Betaproteobacteria bacterium]